MSSSSRSRRRGQANPALSFSFNQDVSCVAVGKQNGFTVTTCRPFRRHDFPMGGGVRIVEMLHRSAVVAVVGGGKCPAFSQRCLRIMNLKTMKVLCEVAFDTAVLAVHLNKSSLVVVLHRHLYVFEIKKIAALTCLNTIEDPTRLVALRTGVAETATSEIYLCYPASSDDGKVIILMQDLDP